MTNRKSEEKGKAMRSDARDMGQVSGIRRACSGEHHHYGVMRPGRGIPSREDGWEHLHISSGWY